MSEESEEILIYSFPMNNGEEIRIAVHHWQGKHYIDLRQWFESRRKGEEGLIKPTKRGIIFPMERLPEFKEGVDKLLLAWDKIPQPVSAKRT